MKRSSGKSTFLVLWSAVCVCLFAGLTFTSAAAAGQFTSGQKAKIKGTILARSGDLVKIQDKKSGSVALLKITDDTKMQRDHGKFEFYRHTDMDVAALLPLTKILAPGAMGTSKQVAPDTTAEGQAENRRVVVRVLQNKGIAGT
jgi:hypothetical protein